jgi:hypothetical protein
MSALIRTASPLFPRNSTEMLTFVAIAAFVFAASVTVPSVSILLLAMGVGCLILEVVL